MADTSPLSQTPQNQAPGAKKPANHKTLIIILIIVAALGIAALLYAMYSSSRNSGDSANASQTTKTATTGQKSSSAAVTNQPESTQQTVGDVGQETTLTLYANSGKELVNTVQTVVNYPSDLLQVVTVTSTSAFPNAVATNTSKAGQIQIVRAVANNASSVKGEQAVAVITFKKIQTVNASTAVTVDKSQSFLVTSSDNHNLIGTSSASLTVR